MVKVIMKIVQKGIKKSKLEKGLHTFVLKTVKIILYFIAILIIADMMGIPISSLLATFSIVGVAASLAIQDTLSNIASGITILATNPFRVENYVDAGGVAGTVKEINLTHTVLKTPDNKVIHVPNKQMVNSTVTNFSQMPKRRVDITFNLDYKANGDRIKEIMREAINKHELILKNEEIFVRTTAYGASGIDYTLRVWTKSADYWTVYFDLLEGLKKDFDNEGIQIPYNQLDVHVHNV
jgi:small conductance mechanosensitive channel